MTAARGSCACIALMFLAQIVAPRKFADIPYGEKLAALQQVEAVITVDVILVGFGIQASGSCAWPTSVEDGKIAQLIMKHKNSRFSVQEGVDGAVPTAARLEVRVHRAPLTLLKSLSAAIQAEMDAHHSLLEPEVAFSVLRAAEDPAKQGVTVYVINPSIEAAEHPLQYWYRASCAASSASDRGCGAQVASECASVGGIPEDIDGGHGARCRLLIDLRAGPSSYGRRSSQTGKVNAASMLTTHPDYCSQHDTLEDSDPVRAANAPIADLVMHSVQHMIVRQSTAVDVRERAVLRLLVVSQHPQSVRGWLGTDSVPATPLQPGEGTTLGVEMGWSRYDVAQLYVKCQNGGAVGITDQDRRRVCDWVRGLAGAGQALDGHAPLARSALEVEIAIVRWDSCLVCQQAFEVAIESHKVRLSSNDWAVAEWVQADVLAHMLRSLASTSGLKSVPPTDMLHRLWSSCGRGCTPVPAVLFHLPEATQEVMLPSRRLATEVSWSLKPLGVQPWLHHQRSAPTVDAIGDDGEAYELNTAAELPGLVGLSTAASATTFPTDLECNGNAVLLDKHNPFPQLLQGLAAVLFGVQPTRNCFGKVGGAACVWEPVLPVVSEFHTPVCPRSIAPMQWGLSRVLGIAARIQFIASDLLRDIAWIGLDPFQPDTNGVHAAVAAGLTVDEVDQWRAGWNLVHTSLERGLEAANGFDFLTAHRHLNMAIGAVVRLRLRHDAQQATWELTSVCSKPPPAKNVAKADSWIRTILGLGSLFVMLAVGVVLVILGRVVLYAVYYPQRAPAWSRGPLRAVFAAVGMHKAAARLAKPGTGGGRAGGSILAL